MSTHLDMNDVTSQPLFIRVYIGIHIHIYIRDTIAKDDISRIDVTLRFLNIKFILDLFSIVEFFFYSVYHRKDH